VALVCHYLMKKQLWSFQDSIQFIRCRHPAAAPNSSFVEQLKLVERQLLRQRLLAQVPLVAPACAHRRPKGPPVRLP
jgi:protein-tyrosine phosphatase